MWCLVIFLWVDIGISGKLQASSTRKPQVSIKSQTRVIAKKLWKITIFKRLRDVWFDKFFVRWYRNIREVTRVIHAKTPGLYLVPELRYPCHCCRPCCCHCPPPRCPPHHRHHHHLGSWGNTRGRSSRKPQVSIKSQTGVMAIFCKVCKIVTKEEEKEENHIYII